MGMFEKSVHIVRIMAGLQYLWSGLNWWVKILPFPSISDIATFQHKHAVAAAMIDTGWMFELSKAIEVLTGLALLGNVFVPLALVVSMPVAVTTFLLDAFIFKDIYGWLLGTVPGGVALSKFLDMVFFGGVLLVMQGYLMFSYIDYYLPMIGLRSRPRWLLTAAAPGNAWCNKFLKTVFIVMGAISIILGGLCTLWYLGMTRQWLIPWSSLRILAFGVAPH